MDPWKPRAVAAAVPESRFLQGQEAAGPVQSLARLFSEGARARYEDDPQAAAVGANQWLLIMRHIDLMNDIVYRHSHDIDVDAFLKKRIGPGMMLNLCGGHAI